VSQTGPPRALVLPAADPPGPQGERRSLSEHDYAGLIAAAHHQLHAPIILIWDNVNTHHSTVMRAFLTAHTDWLTVLALPAYAPDLNAAESVWANVKNGLGNLAAQGVDHLAAIIRNRLRRIQYRPELLPGFLAQTGLTFDPNRRNHQDPGLSRSVASEPRSNATATDRSSRLGRRSQPRRRRHPRHRRTRQRHPPNLQNRDQTAL
jgi:putative transposase